MSEKAVQAFSTVKEAPALAGEEADPRFTAVQDFLRRFGMSVTGGFEDKAGSGDACQIR
jgi:hypothetical protein